MTLQIEFRSGAFLPPEPLEVAMVQRVAALVASAAVALSFATPAGASGARPGTVQAIPTKGLSAQPFLAPSGQRGWMSDHRGARIAAPKAGQSSAFGSS